MDAGTYDAVIIGAGMSGLVCGCYLAKAGMKVLIVEKHNKPGGYCTSFRRQGFTFDAAAHSMGGCKHGILGKVFSDLEIERKLQLLRFDPSNIVITPNLKISFWSKLDKTINEFQICFPEESDNIEKFIQFLIKPDPENLISMRNWTFKRLLDQFFNNDVLKAIFSVPLGGYTGLPSSRISAFLGLGIFKESILDGGYYPDGGMQALSNALAEILRGHGGELRLSSLAKRIKVKDNIVTGVVLETGEFIKSKFVISACDARQTFLKLIQKEFVKEQFLDNIENMISSASMFILYLGMNEAFITALEPRANLWFLSHTTAGDEYFSSKDPNVDRIDEYLMHLSPDKKSIVALRFAPFKNKEYWEENKIKWQESFIEKIGSNAIPEISKFIQYRETATPHTLQRYTFNYKGAAFGWAGLPTQLTIPDFRKPSFIRGLYLTGHWTTHGLGIPGVAYVGYDTAKTILKKKII